MLGCDSFADSPRKRGRSLAVEIAFETVTDRLMQEHAGPARPEHYGHVACRRGNRPQIDIGLAHGFCGEGGVEVGIEEAFITVATAGSGITLLAAIAVLEND